MAEFHWRKKRLLSKDENKNKKTKKEKDNSFREIALTKMAKRQLLVTLLSIFGVTFVAFGSAFAVFTTTVRSEDYNTIAVGTLNITFGTESTIDLNGQYPVTDAVGLASTAYTFTIKNTGTLAASYTVHIQDDTDMISQDGCSGSQLDKNYIKYSLDGSTVNILGNMVNNNNYQISTGSLDAGESRTYTIRVWIADGAPNSILNKHYHGKIVVNGSNTFYSMGIETLLAKANDSNITNYNNGDTKEMYVFTHDETEQTPSLTEYRYIGSSPNNYAKIGSKTYRIMGVFPTEDGNGNWENRIRLTTSSTATSTFGSTNNYATSTLRTYINSSGMSYMGITDAVAMADNVKWYLGGSDYIGSSRLSDVYTEERGTNVYGSNATNTIYKVGVLYPTVFASGTLGNTAAWYHIIKDSSQSGFANPTALGSKSWLSSLMTAGSCYWFFYPSTSGTSTQVRTFSITSEGYFAYPKDTSVSSSCRILPTFYLSSNVQISSGTGTSSDPYILTLPGE